MFKKVFIILTLSLFLISSAGAATISWDFENGNDHLFDLWSVFPAAAWTDDPSIAGDEAITGVGGHTGLPEAGVAWSIGRPDQFDGQKPAFNDGDKAKADGTMEYNQPGLNHPFTFPVNGREQESYLNTYNLTQWGDDVHTDDNDQIATSPLLLIGANAQLTVWVHGGGSGTHAPELDSDSDQGYTTDSAGIAVLSAADGSLLSSVLTNGQGTLRKDTIDLSEFAGQTVYIEVVDAFQGGWGWIAVDEIQVTNAIELGEAGPYPKAWAPNPTDGALHEDTWVNLSWTAGAFAVSHDVYLGNNFDDVENATRDSDIFQGNQPLAFYVAGFPGFAFPEGLVPGTTYYWRIDEVNDADPNSPWKGDVWSFSIPPKTAYNPDPVDGNAVENTTVTLSWTAGFGAKLHTIYFGDDFEAVANATVGMPVGITIYNPGPLETEKVYYWRVDEFDGLDTYKGDVWTFTTPGAVGNPQPAHGATDVAMAAVLSWTAADNAASHEVYLGVDKDAVRGADTSSPEYKGSKTLGAESYDAGLFEPDTTYYWRVDEVYAGSTVEGPIWTFTVGVFLLVDDFESYTDDDAAGEAIWQTWIDGFGVADNGAQVGYLMPPYAEQTIVHGGSQSMPLVYVNEASVTNSEASLILTALRDFTTAGVGELSLWFRGSPANAADPLYVAISNAASIPAMATNDDPAAATMGTWTEWRIPLQAFADQGINLTNVDKLAIGLGSKGGAAVGGLGTMYIDDIRLYRPTP